MKLSQDSRDTITMIGFALTALTLLWFLMRNVPGVGPAIKQIEKGVSPFEAFGFGPIDLTAPEVDVPDFSNLGNVPGLAPYKSAGGGCGCGNIFDSLCIGNKAVQMSYTDPVWQAAQLAYYSDNFVDFWA